MCSFTSARVQVLAKMQQYLDLVRTALAEGAYKPNRTGVDTLSTFGTHYDVDLQEGFPLLTTKDLSGYR